MNACRASARLPGQAKRLPYNCRAAIEPVLEVHRLRDSERGYSLIRSQPERVRNY